MSLKATSDVSAPPPSESRQDDSLAVNGLATGPSEHQIATSSIKGASRGSSRPLTNAKYEHFAHLVAKGESPAKAYVLCGYSQNGSLQSGNRLLRKPEVSARVEELKKAVSERQVEKIAVDRAWVVAMLIENVQRAMQVEPVRDREGNPIGQYTYQGGAANKALELLGKELGMFLPKHESTDDMLELTSRINAGRERVGSVGISVVKARLNAGRQRVLDAKRALTGN
jgi:phage terminase small subunit